jgi:HSP20 family protein
MQGLFMDDFFAPHMKNKLRFNQPPVNISESSEGYLIELAAPGLKKELFKLDLNKEYLSISYDEQESSTEAGYRLKEFNYTHFKREFSLPDEIDRDNISAKYESGILLVNIPKLAKQNPESRTIQIA